MIFEAGRRQKEDGNRHDITVRQHGHRERRLESGNLSQMDAQKVTIGRLRYIRNPVRLFTEPDTPRQSSTRRKMDVLTGISKRQEVVTTTIPGGTQLQA